MKKCFFILWIGFLWVSFSLAQAQDLPARKKAKTDANRRTKVLPEPQKELAKEQDETPVKVTKTFSKTFNNPSVPAFLNIEHYLGDILIEAYEGKEVKIEASMFLATDYMEQDSIFTVLEANNTMIFKTDNERSQELGTISLKVQIPAKTSLKIKLNQAGTVTVKAAERLVEIDNPKGSILLEKLKGWAIINTVDGNIKAEFLEVIPNKSMSFVSYNGNVDLIFPSDLKANFRLKSNTQKVENAFSTLTDTLNINLYHTKQAAANNSQQTNMLRAEDIELQEKAKEKLKNEESRARSADDRSQNLKDEVVSDKKSEKKSITSTGTSNKTRMYIPTQTYNSRANEGGAYYLIASYNGYIKIEKQK
jgi:hypothetical protein